MSKSQIAVLLFKMKRAHQSLVSVEGELFSADELLTRFYSREVSEEIGQEFIKA
jgi:hypothetical protein